MKDGIDIFDEVERDGREVSGILFNTSEEDKVEVIKNLTRKQKILFLIYVGNHQDSISFYSFYVKSDLNYTDEYLNELVYEADWIWK